MRYTASADRTPEKGAIIHYISVYRYALLAHSQTRSEGLEGFQGRGGCGFDGEGHDIASIDSFRSISLNSNLVM